MPVRQGILTAGSWVVDNNKTLQAWPAEDTMNTYVELDRQGGGSGCNMAIDLKKLDPSFHVETMAIVGDDDDGRYLLGQCDQYGIQRRHMQVIKGGTTPFCDCFNSIESGKRTHLYYPGVAEELCPDHFDFRDTDARILHLGLPGAHKRMDAPWGEDSTGWATVLKAAGRAGLKANLEMVSTTRDRIRHFGRSCLPHLDFLIVNDYEIGAVADVETRDGTRTLYPKVVEALRAVFDLGSISLAVAHFPEAAIAMTRDGNVVVAGSVSIPSSEIVGVNGAGDAFAAGVLYASHEGQAIEDALRMGHACAAASMRSAATTNTVVSASECLALVEKWGFRPAPL